MTYDLTSLEDMLSCIVEEIRIVQDHIQEIVTKDPTVLVKDNTLHLMTSEIRTRGDIITDLIVFRSVANAVRQDKISLERGLE